MLSGVIILVMVCFTMGAPQQRGYTIQAPSSNSLQPGREVSISMEQPSFGSFGPTSNTVGTSLGLLGVATGQVSSVGSNVITGGTSGQFQQPTVSPVKCAMGEVLHVNDKCVKPIISRNIFVFSAPKVPKQIFPVPEIPKPKVEYNIVFVRTSEAAIGAEPIIVPPPQQKTLVYVLSKKVGALGPQVIEVPAGPDHQPEVFYINYADGENPTLPGGVNLQQALSAAATTGQFIGGDEGTGISAAGVSAGAGADVGGSFGGSSTGNGGQSSPGGSFIGLADSSNFGGSGQGQSGSYVPSSNGGSFSGGSPSGGSFVGGSPSGGNFIGTTNTGSNFGSPSSSNSFSSNFNGGSQGNGGGFLPSVQAPNQAPAAQAPSGLYNRPN